MTGEPTRKQEEYIDKLAALYGSTHVRPWVDGMLLVCGWEESSAEGGNGHRADGAVWEWLSAGGNHGPVDGVREALKDVVGREPALEPARPPSVPGSRAEDLVREALRQVVEHWPDDLRDVSIRAMVPPDWRLGGYRMGAHVALLGTPDGVPLGLILRFTAADLRSPSPIVAQQIQREHRAWKERER